jgi:hypothetical protein
MTMHTLTIPSPADLPAAVGATPNECEHARRFLVAAKLYELGRLTSGQAAAVAGLSRVAFLTTLGRYQMSIFNSPLDALEEDIQAAQARARRTPPVGTPPSR